MVTEFWERCRVPPRLRESSLDKVQQPAKLIIGKYISTLQVCLKRGWGLLLFGELGTGKTSAACSIIPAIQVAGKTALFIVFEDIPKFLIDKVNFDEDQTMEERIHSVDFLIIDEVFLRGTPDNYRDGCVESLFRKRVLNMKSTVITTNYSTKKINDLYPAFSSVLKEATLPIHFKGENLREQSAEEMKKALNYV